LIGIDIFAFSANRPERTNIPGIPKVLAKERGLLATIEREDEEETVHLVRSEEARAVEGSLDSLQDSLNLAQKARKVKDSRDRHRLELAQLYLKEGRKEEATRQLVAADLSQKANGPLGQQIRNQLKSLRGF
jgi:hypothetical protein